MQVTLFVPEVINHLNIAGDQDLAYVLENAVVINSRYYNPNQKIEINKQQNTITYTGERHPLHQDGILDFIAYCYGIKYPYTTLGLINCVKNIKVLDYKTSDTRLYWYETLDYYIATRASASEVMSYLSEHKQKYSKELFIKLLDNQPNMKDINAAMKCFISNKSFTLINAEFDALTLKSARILYKYFKSF